MKNKEPNGCIVCLGLCVVAAILSFVFDIHFGKAFIVSVLGLIFIPVLCLGLIYAIEEFTNLFK
jgi:hypothetical protein